MKQFKQKKMKQFNLFSVVMLFALILGLSNRVCGQTIDTVSLPDHTSLMYITDVSMNGELLGFNFVESAVTKLVRINGSSVALTDLTDAPLSVSNPVLKLGDNLYYVRYTGVTYGSYPDSEGECELVKYNGTTFTRISNPVDYHINYHQESDNAIFFVSFNPVVNGSYAYFHMKERATNQYRLFKFDGTQYTLCPGTAGYTSIESTEDGKTIIEHKDSIFALLYDASYNRTIGRLEDDGTYTIIPNITNGKADYTFNYSTLEFNDKLFFRYVENNLFVLGKLDNGIISTIISPEGYYLVHTVGVYNEKLYLVYADKTTYKRVIGTYDGTNPVEIIPFSGGVTAINNSTNHHTKLGNNLLFYGINEASESCLVKLSPENTFETIPNTENLTFDTYAGNFCLFGNRAYFYAIHESKFHLCYFDGTALGVIDNLIATDNVVASYNNPLRVFNDNLYFIYNGNSFYKLGYLVSSPSLITDVNKLEYILYPNPSSNILNISDFNNKANITIFDLTGKVVVKKQISENQINISNLLNGTYLIKIETANGIVTKKFVKQ